MSEGRFTGEYEIIPPMKKAEPALTMTGTDPRPDSDYDPAELALGIKTEMEHTDDTEIAKKIAKDHLDEDARYYAHLIEMEQEHKNDEVKGRLH
jgi:hypothetical protein